MDRPTLHSEAEELLERMQLLRPREPGERLRPADKVRILELAGQGLAQERIAEQLGCHQSTISRVLDDFEPDTSALAVRRFKASALEVAERVIAIAKHGSNDEALKAARLGLTAGEVLSPEGGAGNTVQVAIVLGVQVKPPTESS